MNEEIYFNIEDINIEQEETEFIQPNTEESTEEINEEKVEEGKEAINEQEKIEEESDKEAPSDEQDESSQNSTLYALAKYLKEEGALYLEDDALKDVDSLEKLKELVEESNKKAKYVGLTESQIRYQEALEAGIPKAEFEDLEKDIQTFMQIKEEDLEANEQLRFELSALDLIDKGLEKEKAIKLAKLSLTDESNIEDSKAILKNMIESKKSKYKELIENKNKESQLALEDIKKAVFEKDKFLETELNDNTKTKLFDLMTTKVGNDANGLPMNKFQKWQKENPIEANIFTNYLFMMTNEGKDLGLIKKTSNSKATKELEKKLKTLNFDKQGALIIPDELMRDKKTLNDNKLTINI